MREIDASFLFGEWLPDLPDMDNPGVIDVENMIPEDGAYGPLRDMTGQTYADALTTRPVGAFIGNDITGTGGRIFAATATNLWQLAAASSGWSARTPTGWACSEYVRFSQFDNYVIATCIDQDPQFFDLGAAVNFAPLASTGTAPRARQIATIGRFVVVGDTSNGSSGSGNNHLQWSAIDQPRNWPTPGSATAVAFQAGEQFMPSELGQIRGIVGGDQFGIVLQLHGLTRLTYIGGDLVFQFDPIERGKGCFFPNSVVQYGGLTYYISQEGFHVTDGVRVDDIGDHKVNKYFASAVNYGYPDRVYGGVDYGRKLIYWNFVPSSAATGVPTKAIVYNITEKRFSKGTVTSYALFTGLRGNDVASGNFARSLHGFDSTFKAAHFEGGLPADATITTAERELNPGGFTLVQGIKPLLDGTQGFSSQGIELGYRNSMATTPSFTAAVQPNSRTSVAAFRNSSRLHRARLTLTGSFTKARGLALQAKPDGFA